MNEVERSFDFSHGVNHYELNTAEQGYIMSHEKEVCSPDQKNCECS